MKLKEVPFGLNDYCDEICIYTLGHKDPSEFLKAVRSFAKSDVPQDARDALTVEDVEHLRFRPMSPSEARSWGCGSGVMETIEPRGYGVTAVKL